MHLQYFQYYFLQFFLLIKKSEQRFCLTYHFRVEERAETAG